MKIRVLIIMHIFLFNCQINPKLIYPINYVGPKTVLKVKWNDKSGHIRFVKGPGPFYILPKFFAVKNKRFYIDSSCGFYIVVYNNKGKYIKSFKLYNKIKNVSMKLKYFKIDNVGNIICVDYKNSLKKIIYRSGKKKFEKKIDFKDIYGLRIIGNTIVVNGHRKIQCFNGFGKKVISKSKFLDKNNNKYKYKKILSGTNYDKYGNEIYLNFQVYLKRLDKFFPKNKLLKKIGILFKYKKSQIKNLHPSFLGLNKYGDNYWRFFNDKILILSKNGDKQRLIKLKYKKGINEVYIMPKNIYSIDDEGSIYRMLYYKSHFEIVKYERRKKNP